VTLEELANHAHNLAAQGIPVFPCTADKRPAIPKTRGGRGFYDAVTDPGRARAMFMACPNAALIAMPTGLRTGIIAIDIDPAAIRWFKDRIIRFTETRIDETPRGGWHLLYQCPDPPVRNSTGKLARGCDVRGEGGSVVIPPSPGYRTIHEVDIAPLPRWIIRRLAFIDRKRAEKALQEADRRGGAAPARDSAGLERFVAASPPGERNSRLYWAACRLGEMSTHGKIKPECLLSAALRCGLDPIEIWATIKSGLRASQRSVRTS